MAGETPRSERLALDPTKTLQEENKTSFWSLLKAHKWSVLVDCMVFGLFGMGVAFLGPTLFDLGCQTHSDLKQMNWVFFVQLIMTMIGSVTAGCLTGRLVPAHVLLCIGMTGLPVTMLIMPFCKVLWQLLINLMIMGWFMGCVDCVANLRMILRFNTNVTPFLQAMHFFYGLGAFVSPMIVSPFLLNVDCTPFLDGYTVSPVLASPDNSTVAVPPQPKVVHTAVQLSHSKQAFFILASIQFVIAIIVYLVVAMEYKWGIVHSPPGTPIPSSSEDEDGELREYTGSKLLTRYFRCGTKETFLITALASFSLFMYDGLQSSFADYIYSYAEKDVADLDRSEGAALNSCFWGSFALGRLVAILLSTRLSAAFLLLCNLSGCLIGTIIMLIWEVSRSAVYTGTVILGLFLSSMSPTMIALSEQFININAAITSCMVVFAALGESLCPVIVGNLFVAAGPISLLGFTLALILLSVIVFGILFAFGRDTAKYREHVGSNFIRLPKTKTDKSKLLNGDQILLKPNRYTTDSEAELNTTQ